MAMTAFQKTLKNHLGQTDVDPAVLQKAGVSQMGAQMSNANSGAAQATASAVKTAASGPMAQANEALAAANAGKMQLGGAVPVNPNTPPPNQIQPSTGGKDYLMFGKPDAGFQSGMSVEDQTSWNAIGKKYAAGDNSWTTDTNPFREDGKWGSYYDDNGNINGWLYAANGTGGYAPVFGGKVGESGYKEGTVFFSPDGKAYTMGADGSLTQSGNVDWAQFGSYIGPKTGYQDSSFWALDENGQYKKYTNQTAPDSVLEAQGYYRDENGLVRPINNEYYIAQGIKNGQITPEQAALANDWYWKANEPGGSTKIRDTVWGTAPGGGQVVNLPGDPNKPASIQNLPGDPNKPASMQNLSNTAGNGGNAYPSGNGGGTNPSGSGFAPTTSFQDFLDQWDYGEAPQWTGGQDETWKDIAGYNYGTAPEWEGTPYQEQRDKALENAQNMQYTDDGYIQKRDELLENAMQEYGGNQYDPLRDQYLAEAAGMEWDGSPYDQQRDEALAKYGEEWQGSKYQKERDDALKKAQNMQWNYDPNTDPVWQALQKQYRREGDRATRQTMGQAAAMTGGVPSSYAMTAASQAGNNYAAQLSDRLPQVYQDAYNRYLQEFQRQMGISDQYAGFDDREYSRWADQQGKNLDLADRYNQYGQQDYGQFMDRFGRKMDVSGMYNQLGQQDYGQYMDRVNQQLQGADRYNGYDQTNYQRFMDEYGRRMDAVDRYNQYGEQDYAKYRDRLGQFNTDRDFQHGVNRETVADAERANQTDYQRYLDQLGQYNTDKNFEYERLRDAVDDARYEEEKAYERAWNEEQRKYERWMDQVNLDFKEREFAQQLLEYADSQKWKIAEWEQYLREYGDQLTEREREWVYKMTRDSVDDAHWQQSFDYGKEQDAIDNQYRTDVFNQSIREYDDQQAAEGKQQNGQGGPSDTGSSTSSSVGSQNGSGMSSSGNVHSNGQPKSPGFDSLVTRASVELKGKRPEEAERWVSRYVRSGVITQYEADLILQDLLMDPYGGDYSHGVGWGPMTNSNRY